jgi:hypothetical protein
MTAGAKSATGPAIALLKVIELPVAAPVEKFNVEVPAVKLPPIVRAPVLPIAPSLYKVLIGILAKASAN